MKSMYLSIVMSVILSLAACKKTEKQQQESLPAQVYKNVSYGTDSFQKMDVYLPQARSTQNTKVLVMIHGGAWSGGDKTDFNTYVTELQKRLPDYAIININYRLANYTSNYFPTQENDVKKAINFILDKKEDYQISNDIVLLGASAGGHLALLHAYKYLEPVKIKAVISFFGPTDLVEMYNVQTNSFYKQALGVLIGGTPSQNLAVYHSSSPIRFVTKNSTPTLLLHGGRDYLVSVGQSKAIKTKLDAAGVKNDLVIYQNEGHGWIGKNLTNSFDRIEAFLKETVE